MKEEEVISLSNKCNFNAISAYPLKLEASARQYWRVTDNSNQSKILCYLDPDLGDHLDFINISSNLKKNDISCSNVIHHNSELGITIQDDLGDDDLLSILTDSNKKHFLQESLKVLIKVQNTKISAIKNFLIDELKDQMNLFNDIFCEKFLKISSNQLVKDLILETLSKLNNQPWLNCHYDFERRNLILNKQNVLSIIDFQDMRIGPIGIDLAGILVDHYYEIDFNLLNDLLQFYKKESESIYTVDELFEFLRWGSIQRNIRILGTLANLYVKEDRSYRLKDLPMILKNLIRMIPEGNELKILLREDVQPLLSKRISEI